ncbi:Na+:H+ antiporter, NhaA family [Chryseolinea serpens]|uniref:Na(+)/H(+) antiporter NhaA n=1 Tax=Chryseolinea serpens TaxID=947013 RepID=A0A1M5XCD3_9BACT|nr:Na+/H+ antiporter NhaA [Chryseolinea serpens]SHH97436.1 Na+:H+ antiporter, NhaA family [Chryseolinea serpens]
MAVQDLKITKLFNDFFHSEKASGMVLMGCTIVSLLLTNSFLHGSYLQIWEYTLGGHPVEYWINDGLMTIFFLLVGLELEREVYIGELSNVKLALLPVIAALGGMLVPAGIHFLFNGGTTTQGGAGIPMATDIAFALAALSLLGNRVPASLKVFLTALAVIDDLGAILVIAFFYTDSLAWTNLLIALSAFGVLLILNRIKVRNLIPYLVGGVVMWYFMLHSGIHATISGVLLAFAIPFGNGDEKSTSYILQQWLHRPVAFMILPLFALANTCVVIPTDWFQGLLIPNSTGILLGLVLGKPIGIFLFSFLATKLKLSNLPGDLRWNHIFGVGLLGGIGFTMSIFVTLLAFNDPAFIDPSKIAIMIASVMAGLGGYFWLSLCLPGTTGGSEETLN